MRTVTVCYSVLFDNFNDYTRLQQSIEYNRLMGAEHFFIYVESAGTRVEALLKFYKHQGFLTVLSMPDFPAKRSWYHGQNTAINDCHCRARYTSSFVLVQDFDEFVLPLQHESWMDLIKEIDETHHYSQTENNSLSDSSRPIASYAFIHSYYCSYPLNSSSLEVLKRTLLLSEDDCEFVKEQSVLLLMQMQRMDFHDYPKRVKNLYRPEQVVEPGTHCPHRLSAGSINVPVDTRLAFLAHHRVNSDSEGVCFLDMNIRPFFKQFVDLLKKSKRDFEVYSSLCEAPLSRSNLGTTRQDMLDYMKRPC